MHFKDEGISAALEDVALANGIPKVLILYKERFVQNFHSHCILKRLWIVFQSNLEDFAERTLSEHILDIE